MSSTSVVIQDRFQLKERLFSEGNQAAYVARDTRRSEDVLLFLVPPSSKLDEKVDRAVRADIERAFNVESPTLLPLLDLSEAGDYRFLVMPMPRGTNAWERITKERAAGKRLGPVEALRAADDLIAAARAAQAQGTILGFSPKQVWIAADGSAQVQYYWLERVYLHDDEFGLPEQAGIKTLGVEGGYFQAPEMSAGRSGAAAPADQFFIGAILYALLTGEVPGGTLAPIRRGRSDVSKPFAKGVERALAQDPARRHADLEGFRRALYKQPAKLGHLLPLMLLLVGLWAGFALFLGGADLDDWAFPAEREARREAAFRQSRPTAEPVRVAQPDAVHTFRGAYATAREGRAPPEFELHIGGDGTFLLTDRSRDEDRRLRGIWWREDGGTALVLIPVGPDARRGRAIRVEPGDGDVSLVLPGATGRRMSKVGWEAEAGMPLVPLVRLDEPLAGRAFADADVRVAGEVAVTDTEVTVLGVSVPVVGTRFDTVVKVTQSGPVDVVVEASAPDGFRSTLTRTVQIDAAAPKVDVSAGLRQSAGVWELHVDGQCKDDGEIAAVSVNDEAVALDGEGRFSYERKGADALAHAFTEVVAVDKAGRATRRLLWASVPVVDNAALASLFEKAEAALSGGRTDEAEDLLDEIRTRGGLIEQLPPELVVKLVHGKRAPRISVEKTPEFFENDGTQTITLSGSVEWFAPDDKLLVGGRSVDVEDGRFTASIQAPKLGRNLIPIQIERRSKAFAKEEVEVFVAAPDGDVPEWTGRPVHPEQRKASARLGLPIGVVNEHGMRFVLIPPGSLSRRTNDGVRFEVKISKPYYMQVREVTRASYERITGKSLPKVYKAGGGPLPIAGATRPASGMRRADVEAFARRLSRDGEGRYRLPTEAEWEHAARGGDNALVDYWGGDLDQIAEWANYADLSILSKLPGWPTHMRIDRNDESPGPWPVGRGRANAFGLRDMLGNVFEWVSDYWADDYDPYERDDPRGPSAGSEGVVRGGGFTATPNERGVAARFKVDLGDEPRATGVRLVLEAEAR